MGKKKTPKKETKRSKAKYPALDKKYNLKSRQDLIDFDYLGKLNEKELKWLNSFVEEDINANFNHTGPKLYKTKAKRKECYDRNNARNRCIWTRAKAAGVTDDYEKVKKLFEDNKEEDREED